MKFVRLITFAFSFLIISTLSAQEKDLGSNIGVELQKKFGKKFSLSLSEELRLDNNLQHLDRFSSTLGGSYLLVKKHLKTNVSYGALVYNKESYCRLNHRLTVGLTGSTSAGSFVFSLRAKYQTTFKDERYGKQYKVNPEHILRLKADVDYSINKIHLYPFVSFETYYEFFDKDFNKFKYEAGLEKKFNKKNSLALSYELRQTNKLLTSNINLGYKFKF